MGNFLRRYFFHNIHSIHALMAKCMCFDLSDHYPPLLQKQVCGTTKKVLRMVKSEGFDNTTSLLGVKIDNRLMEVIEDLWDQKVDVFRFKHRGLPNNKQYAQILDIRYDPKDIVFPSLSHCYKRRSYELLKMKKKNLKSAPRINEMDRCTLDFACKNFDPSLFKGGDQFLCTKEE